MNTLFKIAVLSLSMITSCLASTVKWQVSGLTGPSGTLLNGGMVYVFVGDDAYRNMVVTAAGNNNFASVLQGKIGSSAVSFGSASGSRNGNWAIGEYVSVFMIVFDSDYSNATSFSYTDVEDRQILSTGSVTFSFRNYDFYVWQPVPEPSSVFMIAFGTAVIMLKRKGKENA